MPRESRPFRHRPEVPEVYKKYAELLLRDPVLAGAPVTRDLLEILQMRLTEEEAEFCLNLRHGAESAEQIAERIGRDVGETRKRLDELAAEGNLFSFDREGIRQYSLLIEFGFYQAPIIDKGPEAIDDPYLEKLSKHWVEFNLSGGAKAQSAIADTPYSRVVPIEKQVPVDFQAIPANLVGEQFRELSEKGNILAVGHCACRLAFHKCDRPTETCIMIGPQAEYYVRRGSARKISVEEALDIIAMAVDEHLVQITNNSQDGLFYLCNCCGCCCNILRGAQLPGPVGSIRRATARSGFIPIIDEEKCNGCGVCERVCQVKAIKAFREEKRAEVNRDQCIGCGLCGYHCPLHVITYVRDETAPEIPGNIVQLFAEISEQKGKKFDPNNMEAF